MARISALTAGELLVDSSSQMATRSNLSRLENNIDSCRGARANASWMLSHVTLSKGEQETILKWLILTNHEEGRWVRCTQQHLP